MVCGPNLPCSHCLSLPLYGQKFSLLLPQGCGIGRCSARHSSHSPAGNELACHCGLVSPPHHVPTFPHRLGVLYLDGASGDLNVVQPPKRALPVDEVGGRQLV